MSALSCRKPTEVPPDPVEGARQSARSVMGTRECASGEAVEDIVTRSCSRGIPKRSWTMRDDPRPPRLGATGRDKWVATCETMVHANRLSRGGCWLRQGQRDGDISGTETGAPLRGMTETDPCARKHKTRGLKNIPINHGPFIRIRFLCDRRIL